MEKQKKIIVTGGSGFIGTHFIQDFKDSYDEIVNLDLRSPFFNGHEKYWHRMDLLDFPSLVTFFEKFQPTHVVHLAARTDLDEKKDINGYAVNILGVQNLLNAVQKTGSVRRLVVASSMLVCKVGHIPQLPDEYSPENLYAQSKVQSEILTRKMNPSCIWSIVRPTTIWGPYHERLKNGFFKILQRKMYFHPGNKKCYKSYGYVGNTVFQIQKILEALPKDVHGRTLYLADTPIRLDEWVNMFSLVLVGNRVKKMPYYCMKVIALLGDALSKINIQYFPMSSFRLYNMTKNNVVNTQSIENICTNLPFSMEDGINETCLWLRNDR